MQSCTSVPLPSHTGRTRCGAGPAAARACTHASRWQHPPRLWAGSRPSGARTGHSPDLRAEQALSSIRPGQNDAVVHPHNGPLKSVPMQKLHLRHTCPTRCPAHYACMHARTPLARACNPPQHRTRTCPAPHLSWTAARTAPPALRSASAGAQSRRPRPGRSGGETAPTWQCLRTHACSRTSRMCAHAWELHGRPCAAICPPRPRISGRALHNSAQLHVVMWQAGTPAFLPSASQSGTASLSYMHATLARLTWRSQKQQVLRTEGGQQHQPHLHGVEPPRGVC